MSTILVAFLAANVGAICGFVIACFLFSAADKKFMNELKEK